MKKVYCKHCKFCKYEGNWEWCDVKLIEGKKSEFVQSFRDRETHTQAEFNMSGECPHYEKKRWMFWVK